MTTRGRPLCLGFFPRPCDGKRPLILLSLSLCQPGGKASCQPVPCEATLCSHPAPGLCCPLCHDCLFEGERYAHGQAFQPESCLRCLCQVSAHLRPVAQFPCSGRTGCPGLTSASQAEISAFRLGSHSGGLSDLPQFRPLGKRDHRLHIGLKCKLGFFTKVKRLQEK